MQGTLTLAPKGRPEWPSSLEAAVPIFRGMLGQLHEATLRADKPAMKEVALELRALSEHLGGARCELEESTKAPLGAVPLWGQMGEFIIFVLGIPVRIEQDGVYAVGMLDYPHFGIHAVDYSLPFFSETGYRSFFHSVPLQKGLRPDQVARLAIEHNFRTEMKSKLVRINAESRERHEKPEVIEGNGQYKAGRGSIVTEWHNSREEALAEFHKLQREAQSDAA